MNYPPSINALLVYDGNFFKICRRYYRYDVEPHAWLNIRALGDYLRAQLADELGPSYKGLVRIVEQHLYIGRQARENLTVTSAQDWAEFDADLCQAEITIHPRRVFVTENGDTVEKGVDVELTLGTFDRAAQGGKIDAVILVAGDGDFVPLVQTLARYRILTMIVGFEFVACYPDGKPYGAGVAEELKRAANWYLDLGDEIKQRGSTAKLRALFATGGQPRKPEKSVATLATPPLRSLGTIKNIPENENFGFLIGDDGQIRFFHGSEVNEDCKFQDLVAGMRVVFTPHQTTKGQLAKKISLEHAK